MERLFTQETVEGGDEVVGVFDVGQVAAVRDKVEGTLLETASAALAWRMGNTRPEVPQTTCVVIF